MSYSMKSANPELEVADVKHSIIAMMLSKKTLKYDIRRIQFRHFAQHKQVQLNNVLLEEKSSSHVFAISLCTSSHKTNELHTAVESNSCHDIVLQNGQQSGPP
ncbi:uncharacterized protein LOC120906980 [Anopheles arabiensis]|uniref:uncharacterized protein LOC120906980 n=1 Tax=Anopheles arabiensis TaxID=7173 RepID=UPI001AAD523E|nr:uncharacterized protein LOC120906980 [Anopheles arabiensis]